MELYTGLLDRGTVTPSTNGSCVSTGPDTTDSDSGGSTGGTPDFSDVDFLRGNSGDDHVHGGKGDDFFFGGEGNDRVFGGDGNDVIDAGSGDDIVYNGVRDDLLMFSQEDGREDFRLGDPN